MGLAEIVKLVQTGLSVIELATQAGAAASDIIDTVKKVRSWVDGSVAPTQADVDAMTADEDKYLAIINDTSRDVQD